MTKEMLHPSTINGSHRVMTGKYYKIPHTFTYKTRAIKTSSLDIVKDKRVHPHLLQYSSVYQNLKS